MIGTSIRARLTWWYLGVLAAATLTITGGSWWLSSRSVVRAADLGLQARVAGVRDFLENPRTSLTIADLQDEFGEYAELTRGEALLEVIDDAGVVLCRPAIPGWLEMSQRAAQLATSSDVRPSDRMLGRLPFRVATAQVVAHGRTYLVTVAAPMGPAYDALNRFHRLLILLLPIAIALAGAGGYWVSRRALAPVDRITRAVQAITVQRLDRRLEVPEADDELRRLASTFNAVFARLELAVGDIVRFTADASHELRTPVSLVRATAEIALRHQRSPAEYRAALTEVLGQARQMSELVDDLLVLARTDAGIESPETASVDLRELATEAASQIAEFANARSVSVAVDLPREPIIVRGDAMTLRRLLVILLENAVKYSCGGDNVHLGAAVSYAGGAAVAVIDVSDEGIGLDPDETSRLFERFFRGSGARQHAPDGTGLGLAIARTIVDRHHGSIVLAPASRARGGHGCGARVTLPIDPDDIAPPYRSSLRDDANPVTNGHARSSTLESMKP